MLSSNYREDTFGGHPSLTIFVRYAPNLVSALDPGSLVFCSRKGAKYIAVPPLGIEPGSPH